MDIFTCPAGSMETMSCMLISSCPCAVKICRGVFFCFFLTGTTEL